MILKKRLLQPFGSSLQKKKITWRVFLEDSKELHMNLFILCSLVGFVLFYPSAQGGDLVNSERSFDWKKRY